MGIIFNGTPYLAPKATAPESLIHEARASIGRQIKEARKAKGMTVRELADKCGLAYGHISRVECGRYNVTIDTLSLIAKALDTTLIID